MLGSDSRWKASCSAPAAARKAKGGGRAGAAACCAALLWLAEAQLEIYHWAGLWVFPQYAPRVMLQLKAISLCVLKCSACKRYC